MVAPWETRAAPSGPLHNMLQFKVGSRIPLTGGPSSHSGTVSSSQGEAKEERPQRHPCLWRSWGTPLWVNVYPATCHLLCMNNFHFSFGAHDLPTARFEVRLSVPLPDPSVRPGARMGTHQRHQVSIEALARPRVALWV